jgi:hypothetical protein
MPAITYYGPEEGWEELRAELERHGAEVKPLAASAPLDPAAAPGFIVETVAVLGIEHAVLAAVKQMKSRFKKAKVDVDQWFIVRCAGGCEDYELQLPVDQYFIDQALPRCPKGHRMRIAGLDKD